MNKIAIIGFGGAGYCAAEEARKCDPDARIDVYLDTDIGPYNPMLTTYYVKGAIGYQDMFPFGSLEKIEEELKLNVFRKTPVVGLDAAEKTVIRADGSEESYDSILISTGASAFVPPVEGKELPGVIKMRTAEDAVFLKQYLSEKKPKTGLVIGASWVGIKVLEDFMSCGMDCTLIDGADWAFSIAVFPQTAQRIHQDLENKGVKLGFGQMLDHIEQESDGQLTAVMKNGNRYTADTVAVCIGIRPNVGFLAGSGIAMNRAILVDEKMRTSAPGIYAAGDCCEAYEVQSGQQKNIGVWFNARKQGAVAGANMVGVCKEFGGNALLNLAHYLDYDFISIGDVSACTAEDEVYEYEKGELYIRAVRGEKLKCINMIGTAQINGIMKNFFVKSFETEDAEMDVPTRCHLLANGIPAEFIDFIGGKTFD